MMNDVPYIVHESAQARQERTIKRLWALCIVIFAAFVISNGAWIYYEAQFETTTTTIEAEQEATSGGMSYARGDGRGRGRNAKRDSMGRYSSRGYSRDHQEIVEELRELAQNATSEEMRDMIHDWIRQAEM